MVYVWALLQNLCAVFVDRLLDLVVLFCVDYSVCIMVGLVFFLLCIPLACARVVGSRCMSVPLLKGFIGNMRCPFLLSSL